MKNPPSMPFRRAAAVVALLLLLLPVDRVLPQEGRENNDFKLAVGLYNDGMYDLAVEQLKNFISAYPTTSQGIEARYYLGSAQMKLRRFDEARSTFQNFALSYPDNAKAAEAWMSVGAAYVALKNGQEAASAFERVRVFHPKSPLVPEALLRASEQYRLLGSPENAKRALRTILQDYASSGSALPARVALGEIYAEEGNADLAEKEALRVAKSDAPPAVRAASLLIIGKLQSENSLFDDARTSFSAVVKDFPTSPSAAPAALELGVIEARDGNTEKAVRQFTEVAGSERVDDSLRVKSLLAMGSMYDRGNDYANAQATYEKLLTRISRGAWADEAALAAGRAALHRKRFEDAFRHAERAASSTSPESRRKALSLAGEASEGKKEYTVAAEYYSRFLREFPNDPFTPEILLRLGDLYRTNLAEYRNAVTILDEFRQKYPRHERIAEATYNTSLCQEALNDINGAIMSCRELRKRYPAYLPAAALEERIAALERNTSASREQSITTLASLLGELLTESSKADISFKLGNFYFQTLNDYRSAANYYGHAIDGGITKDHFAEAYFYRARSYHLLSNADSAREKAIMYYDSFLKLYPESRWSDDAAYFSFILKSSRGAQPLRADAIADFLVRHPSTPHRNDLTLELGKRALERGDYRSAIDQLSRVVTAATRKSAGGDPVDVRLPAEACRGIGKAYIALHQLDSAMMNLRTMRVLRIDDINLAQSEADLVAACRDNQRFDSALVLLERLMAERFYSEPSKRASATLGELLIAAGRDDDAVQYYTNIIARQQASPFGETSDGSGYFHLATAYTRRGETVQAKRCFSTYLRFTTTGNFASQAYSALGVFAKAAGNSARASAYFKKAAGTDVTDASQSLLLADQLFQTGQYPEAAKQYRQLLAAAPNSAAKRPYLAGAVVSSLRSDNPAEAEKLLAANKEVLANDVPLKAEALYEKGLYYYRAKDYANAKKAFDDVTDDYAATRFGPWGHYYLGKIHEVHNRLKEAAKTYDEIIERSPNSDVLPRVFLSLGNMHFNAERYEDAIRFFRRVVETADSTDEVVPYALNNLIEAYESTKLYDAAIAAARRYTASYPQDERLTDKRIKIGTLLTKAGYYDQAVENFQALLSEGESAIEAELRYDIGEAYYYKGEYQQAILEFLKVPYLVTTHGRVDWVATSFYMAGQSYEKISKFDEAINMYRQIIDRPGIDATFKAGARKEIDRVRQLTKKGSQ